VEGDHCGFLGPEWTQVDIEFASRQELQPSPRYAGAIVIKDTDGTLGRWWPHVHPSRSSRHPRALADVIHGAISDNALPRPPQRARSVWSATGNITYQCTLVYELLGGCAGGARMATAMSRKLLTPAEQSLLAAAWPREPTRDENGARARAQWAWIQHVWREAERTLGQPLGIELDAIGLLAAIDRMYA